MADYFWGEMSIPKRCMTTELEEIIEDQIGSRGEWNEDSEIITFADDQARFGEFPDIEDYCVEHRIPFNRFSTARFEYDAEWRAYRPDVGMDKTMMTDDGKVVVVDAQPIRNALDEHDDPSVAVKEIRMFLDEYAPVIPPLK